MLYFHQMYGDDGPLAWTTALDWEVFMYDVPADPEIIKHDEGIPVETAGSYGIIVELLKTSGV